MVDFTVSFQCSDENFTEISQWPVEIPSVLEELSCFFFKEFYPNEKGGDKKISLQVSVVGNDEMKDINRKHRNKNSSTDVLSFPIFDNFKDDSEWESLPEIELGDLFICWGKTIEQASEFGLEPWEEFIHLYAHGFLHLVGFDHELGSDEEKLMQMWEKKMITHCSYLLSS